MAGILEVRAADCILGRDGTGLMRLAIRKLVVPAIGIVIALLLAACGSGTKARTGPKTPSTKATMQSASSTSGMLNGRGMSEAAVVKALSAYASKLAGEDELSGAVLIAKDNRVLFRHAYGLADRNRGIPNTVRHAVSHRAR